MPKKDKLVLGSAGKPHADAITVDIDPTHLPDVIHNIQVKPWPFEDNAFKEIDAHHVLEHLDELDTCLEEMHRLCRPDGTIYIEVPYHTSWCAHTPHHKMFFNAFAFDGYFQGEQTWITGNKFICLKKEITFHKWFRFFFLHKLFNKFPMLYERFYCYIFPAEHLKVWMRPVKK